MQADDQDEKRQNEIHNWNTMPMTVPKTLPTTSHPSAEPSVGSEPFFCFSSSTSSSSFHFKISHMRGDDANKNSMIAGDHRDHSQFHDYLQKLNWTHECTKLNMWSLVSKRTWIFPSVRRPLSALSMRIFLTEDSLQKMFRAWTKSRWKHRFVQLYRMPEVTNVKMWLRVHTRALPPVSSFTSGSKTLTQQNGEKRYMRKSNLRRESRCQRTA